MAPKKYLFGWTGDTLGKAISVIAGTDFLLFGYDQGVMGGILTMTDFLGRFPSINPNAAGISAEESSARSTNQGITVACYNLGCAIGAIATIFLGDRLGRRRMIQLGTSIMVVGAILMASAFTLPHFIVGRIITGLGNGFNTSTVPTWQAETSKAHKRGKLVMVEGALIAGGIAISNWVDLGSMQATGSVSWRFPLALQIVFCLAILATVGKLPESPRWLVLRGRDAEARDVLAVLATPKAKATGGSATTTTATSEEVVHDTDTDADAHHVDAELAAIRATVAEMAKGSFRDLFTMGPSRNFHRALLAYLNQVFQQISGCNLITYYAPVICAGLGMDSTLSLILSSAIATEYFAVAWAPLWLIERVGRRKLMVGAAVGQAATMAVLAGVNSASTTGAKVAAIVFLFVFNTIFAQGWLGMTWLYPAEIVPLRIRAPANALSTSANWLFNFLVVMITPVSFAAIGWKTYLIFAVINGVMAPAVYFFYPETSCRSLEEMDAIFESVEPGWRGFLGVVKEARERPRRHGRRGEVLIEDEAEKSGGEKADLEEKEDRSGSGSGLGFRAPAAGSDEESARRA